MWHEQYPSKLPITTSASLTAVIVEVSKAVAIHRAETATAQQA